MIESMTFVEIVGLKGILNDVAPLIQELGVLHLRSVDINRKDVPASFMHRVSYSERQRSENAQIAEIQKILRSLRVVTSRIGNPQGALEMARKWGKVPTVEVFREISRVKRKTQAFLRKMGNIREEIAVLEGTMPTLRFLSKQLGLHAEWGKPEVVAIQLPEARRSLRTKIDDYLRRNEPNLIGSSVFPDRSEFLFVKCARAQREAFEEFLHRDRLAVFEIPGHAHMPLSEGVDKAIRRFGKLPAIHKQFDRELDTFIDQEKTLIRSVELYVNTKHALYKNLHHIAQTEYLFVMEGWVPDLRLEWFSSRVHGRFGDKVAVVPIKDHGIKRQEIPVRLRNPNWLKPYEIFLSLFPAPVYGTLDPTLLLALGFPLFFGFILGDTGYGLVLVMLALWLRGWARRKGNALFENAALIGVGCAISTMIFGLLFGEFFGDPSPFFNSESGLIAWDYPALWHQRHDDFLQVLLWISIAAGAVHITLSLVLGAVLNFREGDSKHGYERLGFLCFFFGVVVLLTSGSLRGLGINPTLLLYGGWGILALGILTLLVKVGIAGLLESISLLANVVSYSRLMAIGVASVVLANVANSLLEPPIGVLSVIGAGLIHTLNIALGILSPAIHSMRLHFVEFLPKFHKEGGNRYQPFAIQETLA